ncbi:hypothetical protein Ddc_19053 [Ditylenchus destructor]|nr:hypothetical protein Ddc_19053 [Ditylenchus destructor]
MVQHRGPAVAQRVGDGLLAGVAQTLVEVVDDALAARLGGEARLGRIGGVAILVVDQRLERGDEGPLAGRGRSLLRTVFSQLPGGAVGDARHPIGPGRDRGADLDVAVARLEREGQHADRDAGLSQGLDLRGGRPRAAPVPGRDPG